MRRMAVIFTLLCCGSVFGQMPPQPPRAPQAPPPPGAPQDPIARQLFPPELIMGHKDELQLTDNQRASLRSEIVKLQSRVLDLQFQLSDEAEKLAALLRTTPVDEAKALEQADKVMAMEREIKRLHLGALIRIKNMLSPDQVARLQELRRREQ